jgi:hypothetical protein
MCMQDNYDAFVAYEAERERQLRLDRRLQADEERADRELPWVTVPQDNGVYPELYFKEE